MSAEPDDETLLEAAERALEKGQPEAAHALLLDADAKGVSDAVAPRFVEALAQANRFLSRQKETLAWIEQRLTTAHTPPTHAVLLRARIEALRHIDTRRVLELADEALAAADAAGNEEAYAYVLAHGSYSAYRRGEVRHALRFAELANGRVFTTPKSVLNGLRARMFAATAAAAHEQSLDLSIEIRDRALMMGDLAHAANECNNIAESQLRLGRPLAALEAATKASDLASKAGFRAVERFSRVLIAMATCEDGALDRGIGQLRRADVDDANAVLTADTDAALSYWLVERNADADDAREARRIAERAVARASEAGLAHYLTTLYCTLARACHRLADDSMARMHLEHARNAADSADSTSERHLAIAMAEILAIDDPARKSALHGARSRLLRSAGSRDDALAYLAGVRLHRRLLELTGGVPGDLPRSP